MLYVPLPWPDEMLSSWFTRISAYYGFSPRRTAFGFLNVWSLVSPTFPRRLRLMAEYLGSPWSVEELLRSHTFYPLVAPFLDETMRRRLAASMLKKELPVHSRKKSYGIRGLRLQTYRFCPVCWAEQNDQLTGDCGWLRMWQIPELTLCPKHGVPLWDTAEPFRDRHGVPRSLACYEIDRSKAMPLEPDRHAKLLLGTAKALMTADVRRLPSQAQWAIFWEKKLGNRTNARLNEAAMAYWGEDWLLAHGIRRVDRTLLHSAGQRIWWKVLLLLKAAAPEATLQSAIKEASWVRRKRG